MSNHGPTTKACNAEGKVEIHNNKIFLLSSRTSNKNSKSSIFVGALEQTNKITCRHDDAGQNFSPSVRRCEVVCQFAELIDHQMRHSICQDLWKAKQTRFFSGSYRTRQTDNTGLGGEDIRSYFRQEICKSPR